MSGNIVAIIGPGGEGGTFLDWTLHYLAGDRFVKFVLVDRITNTVNKIYPYPVIQNPITPKGNAHAHKKTHPTESTVQQCVDLLKTVTDPRVKLHTMYIVASVESYNGGRTYQQVVERVIANSNSTELKFIHMHHPDTMLEELVHRVHTKVPDNTETLEDIRSRVSVACDEENKIIVDDNVYSLNIKDMFYTLDIEIHKILAWLNLPIEEPRYDKWLDVYKQWQVAQNVFTTT